jgi:hypothetical protein
MARRELRLLGIFLLEQIANAVKQLQVARLGVLLK